MNPNARTPGHAPADAPARTAPTTTSSTSDRGESNDAEVHRQAAALARSSADRQARSDAALGEADAARGRADEAAARGDIATAGAEWSDAAGLDGLSAHEATGADIDARAAAAAAKSPSVPPSKGTKGRRTDRQAPAPESKGPSRQPPPPPGAARRNIA
ncbi:hypothetical protein ACLQ2E_35410 [Streptomyces lavendulocolor]